MCSNGERNFCSFLFFQVPIDAAAAQLIRDIHVGLTKRKKGSTFLLLAAEYVRPSIVNATPRSNLDNTGTKYRVDMGMETDREMELEM